jgi:hypothetical protein
MTIGDTGISRSKDLYEKREYNHCSKSDILGSLTQLEAEGIITRTIIKLGGRGGSNFKVFSLTEKGTCFFETETGRKAHVSEEEILKEMHSRTALGYFFKEINTHLDIRKNGNFYSILLEGSEYPLILDMDLGEKVLSLIKEAKEINTTIYYIASSAVKVFGMMDKVLRNNMNDVNIKSSYLEAVVTNTEPKMPQSLLNVWNMMKH